MNHYERYQNVIMDTFGPPQLVLAQGRGAEVWDTAGRRYLDGLGGIAVNSLGHAHPALVQAITAQAATLGHISGLFASEPQIRLAERLLELTNAPAGSRVFFANSGTEANEAAFKMARRVHPNNVEARILALEGAFHGRTMGALSLTHKAAIREPFEPLPAGAEFVPLASAPDPLQTLRDAFAPDKPPVAALFVEPIQGEAGVAPLPAGYLQLARELTKEHGALLVFDEIQTGVGRTGAWFAHQNPAVTGGDPVIPDVMTLAKGLGGGFPIGAVVAFGPRAATLLGRGQHGSTFGGNPLASAAALAVIATIERDFLNDHVAAVGRELRHALITAANPQIVEVRGEGLLLGVVLADPNASAVADAALELGLIANPVAPNVIRLAPPLILDSAQAAEMAEILDNAITKAQLEQTEA